VGPVVGGGDVLGIHGLEEARAPRHGVELGVRAEEVGQAADAAIGSQLMVVPILAGEGALRTLLPADRELLRCQLVSPLLLGLLDLWFHLASDAGAVAVVTNRAPLQVPPQPADAGTVQGSLECRMRALSDHPEADLLASALRRCV